MKKRTRPLQLEALEDRLALATFGVPWPDAHLTLSFAPDGTNVSGATSNLSALLGSAGSVAAGRKEILRAFQTWAATSNVNIGLVADGGQPLGSSGLAQHDPRFGDIRVGTTPLSTGDEVASGTPFDYSGNTWNGDVVFNSAYPFASGNVAGQYDVFSVAVHEAGHTLGLDHNYTDPTSVMAPDYKYHGALSPSDVTHLQALYGARHADSFEGGVGNGSFLTAYNLSDGQDLRTAQADITNLGESDYFKFTAPAAATTVTGLNVQVKVSGLSLLVPRLTVYDALNNVVGTAVAADPEHNDLSVSVPNFTPGATYYAKVEGATTDVFGVGAYRLNLNYQYVTAPATTAAPTQAAAGNNFATALQLGSTGAVAHLAAGGLLTNAGQVDYYQFYASKTGPNPETLTVSVGATEVNGLRPSVAVYDSSNTLMPATVVENSQGTYTVQIANAPVGQTYYLAVSALPTAGVHATGGYSLAVDVNQVAAIGVTSLASQTIGATTPQAFRTMTVKHSGLNEFALAATSADPTIAAGLRMNVYDAGGNLVFTMVSFAGQPLTTGSCYLGAGVYTVGFYAAARAGVTLPDLTYSLSQRTMSDPLDPYPITTPTPPDPNPLPPPIVSNPVLTPPIPLVPVITDPFMV